MTVQRTEGTIGKVAQEDKAGLSSSQSPGLVRSPISGAVHSEDCKHPGRGHRGKAFKGQEDGDS